VRLDLGKLTEAAADADLVPAGFVYNATYSSTNDRRRNRLFFDGQTNLYLSVDPRFRNLTVGGVAVAPVRVTDVEKAITGQAPTSELFAKACESCRSIDAMADIHASADYRQHLATVLSRRALEKAAGLADNAPWNRVH